MGKHFGQFLAFVTNATAITAGIGLTIVTGGTAEIVLAGSVLLGAGISGGCNQIKQQCSDKDEFSYKDYIFDLTVGGATGFITGGAGTIGSKVATSVAKSTTEKIVIEGGISAIGGTLGSSCSKVANNINQDKPILKDLGASALIGGISGGVASGLSNANSSILNKVCNNSSSGAKIVISNTIAGGVSGGLVGSIAIVTNNIITYKKIREIDLIEFIQRQGASQRVANQVYNNLIQKGYLKDGKITTTFQDQIILDQQYAQFQESLKQLFIESSKIFKNLGIGIVQGAIVGSVVGLVSSTSQLQDQINKNPTQNRTNQEKLNSKTNFQKTLSIDSANKGALKEVHKGNQIMIQKQLDNQQQVQGYLDAEKLGIGVKILEINENNVIRMEQLQALDKVQLNSYQKQEVALQLNKIQNVLKNEGYAHQDIKPGNIGVQINPLNQKVEQVKLIDNDYFKPYGQYREIFTPGQNSQTTMRNNPYIRVKLSEKTDQKGFEYSRNFVQQKNYKYSQMTDQIQRKHTIKEENDQ